MMQKKIGFYKTNNTIYCIVGEFVKILYVLNNIIIQVDIMNYFSRHFTKYPKTNLKLGLIFKGLLT